MNTSKYIKINLDDIIKLYGEDSAKAILADFSCEPNKDVDDFLKSKAIDFSKQSIAKTQLIYYISDEDNPLESKRLVGYFSLSHKIVNVFPNSLNRKYTDRLHRFAQYNMADKSYTLPTILIGQLGKNYKGGNNNYITGKDLLELAIASISMVQKTIGGKFIYLESEDTDKLKEFYAQNGFVEFGKRKSGRDETDLDSKYLLQWLCYPIVNN